MDTNSISSLFTAVEKKGEKVAVPTKTLVEGLVSKNQVLIVCLTPGNEGDKTQPNTIYWVETMLDWENHRDTAMCRSFSGENFTRSFYLINKNEVPDGISKAPAPKPRPTKPQSATHIPY